MPRHWLTQGALPIKEEAPYEVTREIAWTEELQLPSWWDLFSRIKGFLLARRHSLQAISAFS